MLEIDTHGTPSSEFSPTFLRGMLSRMGVSFYKYGKIKDGFPSKIHAVDSLEQRLEMYKEDGNTDHLMDVANFAMIEFMHPSHPDAHYIPQDSDTSPGRIGQNGRQSRQPNDARGWTLPGPRNPEAWGDPHPTLFDQKDN